MPNGVVTIPDPVNEPIRAYGLGAPEKDSLKTTVNQMMAEEIEIPLELDVEDFEVSDAPVRREVK